jgi:hypothetical protein
MHARADRLELRREREAQEERDRREECQRSTPIVPAIGP